MTTDLAATYPAKMRSSLRKRRSTIVLVIAAALTGSMVPRVAYAVDGCLVLLCFAAPSWRSIPQCVSPIKQVLRDLARGKPFPTCGMAGGGSAAKHAWASAPGHCPPHYTRVLDGDSGPIYACDFTGAVSVTVNGTLFARTWWSMAGDTVTEFSAGAKGQLVSWDTRFDDDYAAWLAGLPTPALPLDTGN